MDHFTFLETARRSLKLHIITAVAFEMNGVVGRGRGICLNHKLSGSLSLLSLVESEAVGGQNWVSEKLHFTLTLKRDSFAKCPPTRNQLSACCGKQYTVVPYTLSFSGGCGNMGYQPRLVKVQARVIDRGRRDLLEIEVVGA